MMDAFATRSGAARSGAARSGAERSGAARSGVERSGAARSGRRPSQPVEAAATAPAEPLAVAAAAEELFRTEYGTLVRLAVRLVDTRDRAEEIVQESFEKVLLRWDRIANPAAYLRTTVVNGCRGELRRRAITRAFLRQRPAPVEAVQPAEHLGDALAGLAPRRRIALVLRFYLDLPEREIAEWLDVAPGTVKSLISRGLDDLRKVVER